MSRWQGQQRRRRRETLRRNLARQDSAAVLALQPLGPPARAPSETGRLRAEVRRLEHDLKTAVCEARVVHTLRPSQFLSRLMGTSGLRRGLLALCHEQPNTFRVDYQCGFRPGDEPRVDAMALAMLDAIDMRSTQVRMGAAVLGEHDSHPMGAVIAIPVVVCGRLVAAIALEDPSRHRPPSQSAMLRVHEAAARLGPALERCLRNRAQRRLGA